MGMDNEKGEPIDDFMSFRTRHSEADEPIIKVYEDRMRIQQSKGSIFSKVIFAINALWSAFTAFTFPLCLGVIYMDITGHSKGYGYDLGAEKDISVVIGIFELIVWLFLTIPSNVYILKKIGKKKKSFFILYFIIFVLLSGIFIWCIGGWKEYIKVFGV